MDKKTRSPLTYAAYKTPEIDINIVCQLYLKSKKLIQTLKRWRKL